MYLLGKLQHGEYSAVDGIHPNTISHYLDEDEQAQLDPEMRTQLRETIRAELEAQIHHNNDVLSGYPHPFETEEDLALFEHAFETAEGLGIVPRGYDMHPDEIDDDGMYPLFETIKVARKDTDIPLPLDIWYRRAARWVQGLHLMTSLL
jgi:hypothetical protein